MKKRLAVWLYGGVGTGNFSQGQPVLERLIQELGGGFEIIVYSRSLVNFDYIPNNFQIRCAPATVRNGTLRWFLLYKYFLSDHLKVRFSAVCAFWGFPGGFMATLIAKLLGLPIMVNLGGGDSIGIPSLNYGVMHRPLFKKLALWTYRRATLLTTLTFFQKTLLQNYGIGRPIRVIPFGINPERFRLSEHLTPTGSYNFLHVSNYHPIKDVETLLRTFAVISQKKKARLRVIGGDYDRSNIDQLIAELGISKNIEMLGPIPYDQMPAHFGWADILMHTSFFEGQGIVIAEAAMSGVLIAGTEVGLIADLGEERAIIVSSRDFEALARKILQVIDEPSRWLQMKDAAFQWALQHDFFWTVNQFKESLHEIATN